MTNKLSWGIIGTGAIAKTLAAALPHSQTGRLVAVGSRATASAVKFGKEFGLPASQCHASYEALLADANVQAIYITTPHPQHAEWAIRAAAAGKHILCEKPITLNHTDALTVVAAARRHNVFLMEAFMYRCHPQTAKLVELIRQRTIGEVRMIQATFSFNAGFNADSRIFNNDLAGGGILDVGCYPVSISRLIAGAATGKDFADPLDVKGAGHLGQTGVDEWAAAVLRFPGDIIAQVATGVALNQENVVRIFGTQGNIFIPNPWQYSRGAADPGKLFVHRAGQPAPEEIIVPATCNAYAYEADVVGRAIAAGQKQAASPAMTWDDSLGNIQTLDRWRASIGLVYNREKSAAKLK
jgi:predicted dehydrogenase